MKKCMMSVRFFIITFIIFGFCRQVSVSQETGGLNLILIHGIVMDATSQESIPNTHYYINGLSSGVSDDEGKFSLYVYRGDTIRFTFLGYRDLIYPTDSLAGNSYVAGIFMKDDTISIGEVLVFPRLGDLRSEFMNSSVEETTEMLNARNNVMISAYQGVNSSATLGDPGTNYDLIRRKQVFDAYEKGGIPSDKMVGLNLISFIPVSIYLLANGFPVKPEPPRPYISSSELERIRKGYAERLRLQNK